MSGEAAIKKNYKKRETFNLLHGRVPKWEREMIHSARISISILISLIFILSPGVIHSIPKERVLVLGFESRQLNDIQDRLLRETILREFHDKGYSIVPVMEIETLFYGSQMRQIRKLKRDTVKSICEDLKAGFACYGSIAPDNGSKDNEIRPEKNYICSLTVYRRDENRFHELKFTLPGRESLYQYFRSVAEAVVESINKMFQGL